MPSLAPIRMYRGIPATGLTELAYDVPAGRRAIIKHVRITNPTSTDATLTMMIGVAPIPDGQSIYVCKDLLVRASDVVLFEMNEVMIDTEFIWLSQGTTNALHVQISGVEVTL